MEPGRERAVPRVGRSHLVRISSLSVLNTTKKGDLMPVSTSSVDIELSESFAELKRTFGNSVADWVGGREFLMARVIDFYTPESFRKKVTPAPQSRPAKVIEFYRPATKSA
jgi:hypothetical protein